MEILKNATEGICPSFQQDLYNKVLAGGFKQGEIMLISSGRQTGKSQLYYSYGKLRNNNLCKEILLPMKPEPKYKFSRSKWYEVEFHWTDYNEVVEWCNEQFGPHDNQPDAWSRWVHQYASKIQFRDEQDYVWFCMRWS